MSKILLPQAGYVLLATCHVLLAWRSGSISAAFKLPKFIFSLQRKQRRWTVCPMGAHSKPLLQLDLPFGSPSKSLCENPNSVEFHEELHQRFLHDLREREEENNVLAEKRLVVDRHKNMISLNYRFTVWENVKFLV